MEEAPKDKLIFAFFKNNPPTLARWSESIKMWASSSLQCESFHGEWTDYYFNTEWFDNEDLKHWIDIPEVKR